MFKFFKSKSCIKCNKPVDEYEVLKNKYKQHRESEESQWMEDLRVAIKEDIVKAKPEIVNNAEKGCYRLTLNPLVSVIMDKYCPWICDYHVIRVVREYIPGDFYMEYYPENNTFRIDWSGASAGY